MHKLNTLYSLLLIATSAPGLSNAADLKAGQALVIYVPVRKAGGLRTAKATSAVRKAAARGAVRASAAGNKGRVASATR